MIIEYEFQTGASEFDDELGEEYFDSETYYFEADNVNEALADIIMEKYFVVTPNNEETKNRFKNQLKEFIREIDDEDFFEKTFEEELKEYYRSEAIDQYYN